MIVDEWRHYDSDCFKATNRGTTITQSVASPHWRSAYGAAVVSSGRRSWRIHIENVCGYIFIGVKPGDPLTHDEAAADNLFLRNGSGYAFFTVRRDSLLSAH